MTKACFIYFYRQVLDKKLDPNNFWFSPNLDCIWSSKHGRYLSLPVIQSVDGGRYGFLYCDRNQRSGYYLIPFLLFLKDEVKYDSNSSN